MRKAGLNPLVVAVGLVALAATIGLSAGDRPHSRDLRAQAASVERRIQTSAQTMGQASGAQAKTAAPTATPSTVPVGTTAPAAYQEMVNKYCVTCHNERAKVPAGAPLALEKASLTDPGAHAD